MNRQPIIFLDSGIGGLPYYYQFHYMNPQESLIYVADRENFPYGPQDRETLTRSLIELFGKLIPLLNPKLIVLACNTASISALRALRERFGSIPWVGTVPAVKPAVLGSKTRKVGVLATQRTITDPYVSALAAKFGPDCELIARAAPDLVVLAEDGFPSDVENLESLNAALDRAAATDAGEPMFPGLGDFPHIRNAVAPYIDEFRRLGADSIVLGCTHFLFLLESFKTAASPDMRIYQSVPGVSNRIGFLLDQGGIRSEEAGENLLLVTGKAPLESAWTERALVFGLSPMLLTTLEERGGVKSRSAS